MKVVGFHSNELNERGTNVAMFDYAKYNEEILGNKSYILSNANADLTALEKFKSRFEVFLYNNFVECESFAKEKNIEYVYYVKAGDRDGRIIPGCKSCIHAVFQHKDVHGDSYMYISKWLAEKMGLPDNYVPYMVDMPQPSKTFRDKLNIPEDKIIPIYKAKGDVADAEKGRDLILELTKAKTPKGAFYTVIQTVMYDDPSPVHEDDDTMKSWIEDELTWEDVYSKKATEYLESVARGETPRWDSDAGKYIYGDSSEGEIVMGGNKSKTDTKVEDPQANDEIDEELPF